MIMPIVIMVAIVPVTTVSAAFGLEGGLHLCKLRSEAKEHVLDHMVGPDAKNLVSNFSRQMPISQMPSKAHKLIDLFMPDFDNRLRCGLNLQPPSIFELQAISIGHRNRLRKVEQDILPLIRSQANAAAMACVELESESARCPLLRPVPGGAMN